MTDYMAGPVQKYGAALFVSKSIIGIGQMIVVYTGLKMGYDVEALLHGTWLESAFGESVASMGSWAGAMTAAAVTNTFLFPLHLYLMIAYTPSVHEFIKKHGPEDTP